MRPILVTGGGTGGHVFPMVAVAEALVVAGVPASSIRLVGARRGRDATLLAGSPFARTLLPGKGIERRVTPRAVLANVRAVAGLAVATVTAVVLCLVWRPRVVVSVGGFAAVATDLAAVLTRRPLVLVEMDAAPLASHALVARFATRRCTAFDSTDPRAVTTGAPLRTAIEAVARAPVGQRHGAGDRWRIVVMTGSLGAGSVNRAVCALADLWRHRADVEIVHVTGSRDAAACARAVVISASDELAYTQVAFAEMAPLWASCDVAVTRAGAMTLAELASIGIAAVLVPLPGGPGDHQVRNARAVVDAGGAVSLEDAGLDADRLARELAPLLSVPRLTEMESAMAGLGRHGAAAAIAREVLAVARG